MSPYLQNFSISDTIIKFQINEKDIEKFENIFNKKEENNFNTYLPDYNALN